MNVKSIHIFRHIIMALDDIVVIAEWTEDAEATLEKKKMKNVLIGNFCIKWTFFGWQ